MQQFAFKNSTFIIPGESTQLLNNVLKQTESKMIVGTKFIQYEADVAAFSGESFNCTAFTQNANYRLHIGEAELGTPQDVIHGTPILNHTIAP